MLTVDAEGDGRLLFCSSSSGFYIEFGWDICWDMEGYNHLVLGTDMPPGTGSHTGSPLPGDTGAVDIPWDLFGNTGHHYVNGTNLSCDPVLASCAMNGWSITWDGISGIDMGNGPPATFQVDHPLNPVGSDYTLTYETTIPDSGFPFPGAAYSLRLEGKICVPQPEVCGDGMDNDCDGLVDVQDPQCGGTVACATDADCDSASQYCAMTRGSCRGQGVCQVRPVLECVPDFTEVCGCDGNSYANACGAAGAGANVAFEGMCPVANIGEYKMIYLGTLGGETSRAEGINDQGQIVGSAQTSEGNSHAFLYENGMMTDLGTLGGSSSFARDINNTGQVVGSSLASNSRYHVYIYQDGVMTDLGSMGGLDAYGNVISDNGQVVGSVHYSLSSARAFSYKDGLATDLGTLGGDNSFAIDVNNAGQIVGRAHLSADVAHGFLYENDVMIDLGIFPGSNLDRSIAYGINQAGQIVGASPLTSWEHAFLYENGLMIDLGTLDGQSFSYSYAYDINDLSQVVGVSGGKAFLWENGTMTGLGVLKEGSGSTANSINNRGEVVGDASASAAGSVAVLWAPDADSDGYFTDEDCDDADPTIYPGAPEMCSDGKDNDCDGLIDNADVDCGAPYISGVWPNSGPPGTFVFVFGYNFEPMSTQVSVNGVSAPQTQVVTENMLIFLLPEGDTAGLITVTTAGGSASSASDFGVSVSGLSVTGFVKSSGSPGDFVFVFGSGFATGTGQTQVSIGGVNAALVQVEGDGMLIFILPADAVTGPITVTTTEGSVSSSENFIVE